MATEVANLQRSMLCQLCDTDATFVYRSNLPGVARDARCVLGGRMDTYLQKPELLSLA